MDDWYQGLSDEAQIELRTQLKDAQKIENPKDWLCFKKFLVGKLRDYKLWEIEFKCGDNIQYRLIGMFGDERKQAVFVMGCYHKGKVYDPPDALNTAYTRARDVKRRKQTYMNEKFQLISKLQNNKALRASYIRSKVSTNIASQIRALRRREGLTQSEFAQLVDMKQSRISAMERPGTPLAIETLVKLCAALKMGLIVKVSSHSDMLRWENRFSQDEFDVLNLDEDIEFTNPVGEELPLEDEVNDKTAEFMRQVVFQRLKARLVKKLGEQMKSSPYYDVGRTRNSMAAEEVSTGKQKIEQVPAVRFDIAS